MLKNVGLKLFGSRNTRLMKTLSAVVVRINQLESSMQAMSDEALASQTGVLKQRLAEGETLDDILPDAFAVVREVSQRTLGLRHYDVQLMCGMVLHHGKIAEMCTGEGKTLSATLPAFLNALSGHSVHIVTVNPYLAARDADWMRPIFSFLGLEVGVIVPDLDTAARQQHMLLMLCMAPIMSLVLIISVIIWCLIWPIVCKVGYTFVSSMRLTLF